MKMTKILRFREAGREKRTRGINEGEEEEEREWETQEADR